MDWLRRLVTGRNAPVLAGAAAAVWLLLSGADGLALTDLLAGLAAVGATLAARAAVLSARSEPIGGTADGTDPQFDPVDADGDTLPAVDLMLHDIAHRVGAARLVVWEREEAVGGQKGALRAVYVVGERPRSAPESGDPVAWALEARQPVRGDRVPGWARGPVTALPLQAGDRWVVVTAESATVPLSPDALKETTTLLGPLIVLAERETRSRAAGLRLDRLVEFLKSLTGDAPTRDFPGHLARVAAELTGGSGAAVAYWADESGRVLANWGEDGGPAPGTYFGVMDGELAMAARAGSTIRRQPSGRGPTLAQAGERWRRPPRHLTVLPLSDLEGRTRGVVAVWGEDPAEAEGVALLEAVAPVLSLQVEHATALARLSRTAHEDPLTGLANRAALDERLKEASSLFHRYRRSLALMVIDLDRFKQINDTYGHQAGDTVLERVGQVVKTATRDADFTARFGGEEMVVLLPETGIREAAEVAERVRGAIEDARIEWNNTVIPVTASIGVSACPDTVDDPDSLVRTADAALYESKEGGRNRVTIATSERAGA